MNLAVDYLGLKLRNPLVIGASPMGDTFRVAYELQDLGAAAVVMRSLFPEQIPSSAEWDTSPGESPAGRTAEFPDYAEYQLSPESYLRPSPPARFS
jgi:dihydroorotate dehydrogenase (fumarate)